MKESILQEYEKNKDLYNQFKDKITDLLKSTLSDINIQQISGRVKEKGSLEKKIDLKNKYKKLKDITDIIGIRIITCLPDDVDKISTMLDNEFKIDKKNSIDKRIKECDEFGYMSLHLVCELNEERIRLTEYKNFKNIKFEIQVRSILQHAWAEIEHDIGYKSKIEIPKEFKRRFLRLSSLLELADEEFQSIVNKINNYTKNVSKQIETNPENVYLNKNSLSEYVIKSNDLRVIRDTIAKETSNTIYEGIYIIGDLLKMLKSIGYLTIRELDYDLKKYKEKITQFTIAFIMYSLKNGSHRGSVGLDVGLFYLIFIKMLELEDDKQNSFIEQFYKNDKKFLQSLKEVYNEIHINR